MLQSLHIVNFAIIEDTWIDFNAGATIFTGETGSGKSILMDALAILLGRRASVDLIRNGKDFFRVEGVFTADPGLRPLLAELGLENGEDEIIISRRMNRSGRGVCMINGAACPVKLLEKLGTHLVKLHEQNDNTELLSSTFCRYIVDHSDPALLGEFHSYQKEYGAWKEVRDRIADFQKSKQEHERTLDILQWEIEQIESAQIKSEAEDEEVEQRLNVLENHEKIYMEVNQSLELLTGETGAQQSLADAVERIGSILRYDDALEPLKNNLQSALYTVEDAISELEGYAEGTEFSEEELSALQERDNTLTALKNKYGPSLSDVLSYLAKSRAQYDALHEMVYDNEAMQKKMDRLTKELLEKSRRLYEARAEKGALLCRKIEESLHSMNMEHAVIQLHMKPDSEPTAAGVSEMEFYFSANPGEPLRPMRQTASGGEISRISLAIEDIMAHLFSRQTLVFDEIDIGISGGAALKVARKIRHLAQSVQVLCITHMPQTASIADAHYSIRKIITEGHTATKAVLLSEEEHIQDIAWMISGNRPPKESAVQSARDLQKEVGPRKKS